MPVKDLLLEASKHTSFPEGFDFLGCTNAIIDDIFNNQAGSQPFILEWVSLNEVNWKGEVGEERERDSNININSNSNSNSNNNNNNSSSNSIYLSIYLYLFMVAVFASVAVWRAVV